MVYSEGDFVLIKDGTYKAGKFIGEINKKMENTYLLYIYIFPEDTLDGRQVYMSSNEVFLTPSQTTYNLNGDKKNEQKVKVLNLEDYIDKKYINAEKLECPLYYSRQTYLLERNIFDPDTLPNICYCQQIFNPDYPFKKCKCGRFFHPDCLIQIKTSKCWADNCNFNCDTLLSEQEQFQKRRITSGEIKMGEINIKKLEEDFYNEKEKLLQPEQYVNSDNDNYRDKDSDKENKDKDKDNKINIIENEEKNSQIKEYKKINYVSGEIGKEKMFQKYISLKPKLNLCYNISINQTEDNKNPGFELISNIEEIKNILLIKEPNIIKFL